MEAVIRKRKRNSESGISKPPKAADLLAMMKPPLGQRYPTRCPTLPAARKLEASATLASNRLGRALNIRQVAEILGCSQWSVRQTWIPKGLPYLRSGASSGRLIFYEAQLVRWIESQQQEGG